MAGYSVTFSVVDEATKKLDEIRRRIQGVFAPIQQHQRAAQRIIDDSGLKKVAEGFKDVGSAAGTAFSSLARIVPVLGTITGAASLAGMAKLVESTANWANALQLNSTYIGTTSQQLQKMQNGFRIVGGSADTMTESLKNVAKTSYDAFLGRNAVAAQRLTQLGIALRDNNGNLRSAADLQGDEIDRISKITDARDRETTATELGGRALFDVVEQYRLAGKTRQEAEAQAAKYGSLTKEQIEDLHQFHSAMGEVNVAFNRLSEDIGAAMAPIFTPFLQFLSSLVRDHKPAVIAALEAIGAAVTVLGGLFTAQLAVKAVGAVVSLTTSIGTMGLAIAKALGPLGALFAAYEGAKSVIADPGNLAPGAGLWKSFQNIIKGKAPWAEGYFPTDKNPLAPPPPAGTPNAGPVLDLGGNPAAPAGTPTPSPAAGPTAPAPELGREGWYNNPGNIRVSPAAWEGKGQPYTAGSSGGFETFTTPEAGVRAAVKNIQAKLNRGITTPAQLAPVLGPANDKNNPDWLAQQYAKALGIGINDPIPNTPEAFNKLIPAIANIEKPYDARSRYTPDVYSKGVAAAFGTTGTGAASATPAGRTAHGNTPEELAFYRQNAPFPTIGGKTPAPVQWAKEFAPDKSKFDPANPFATSLYGDEKPGATGAPAQVTGGPPVSGSVDVTVTHRNPPPGATVTATGRGDGVNVGQPRVEQQQLQNI